MFNFQNSLICLCVPIYVCLMQRRRVWAKNVSTITNNTTKKNKAKFSFPLSYDVGVRSIFLQFQQLNSKEINRFSAYLPSV